MRTSKPYRRLHLQTLEARYALDGDPALLNSGEEVRREVGQEDPYDEFYFDAQAGDYVWLALQEERPKSTSQVELTIHTPSGGTIYDLGTDSAFEFFQAGESGRFRVLVSERGNEQDFDYKLRFITQPGPVSSIYDQDAALQRGQTHGASLPAGSLSVITFDAIAGRTVFATLGETSTQNAQPQMWIFDPAGGLITSEWGHVSATEQFTPTQTGKFIVIVGDLSSDQPLDYTFSLATLPGEVDYTLPQNAFLQSGQRHTGAIAVGEQHLVQFNADAGSRVFATLGEVGTQAAQPYVRIVDPSGRVVEGASLWSNTGLQLDFNATTTGLYTAVISDLDSNESLSYTFSLATLPGAVDYALTQNALLRSGERRTGAIAVGEQHLVQFNADAGSRVFATLGEVGTQAAQPYIRIVDPNGRVVEGASIWSHVGVQLDFNATTTGLYTAVISDLDSNEPLSYAFRHSAFAHQPDSMELFESALLNGVSRAGAVSPGDFEVYPFSIAAGGTAQISVAEQGASSALVLLQVFDRSGRQVWNGSDASIENATYFSAEAGEYFAVVSESGSNQPLSYSIVATGISAPFVPLPGDFDGNQTVDQRDRGFWASHYGATQGRGLYADGNADGRVDAADFTIWRDRLGTSSVAATSTTTLLSSASRETVSGDALPISGDTGSHETPRAPTSRVKPSARSTVVRPASTAYDAAMLLLTEQRDAAPEGHELELGAKETAEVAREEVFAEIEFGVLVGLGDPTPIGRVSPR